jgi:predicted RNA-binding protein
MEKDGKEELLLENVTSIEVLEKAVAVTTLFEGSREIAGAAIRHMDFLAGKVFLAPV